METINDKAKINKIPSNGEKQLVHRQLVHRQVAMNPAKSSSWIISAQIYKYKLPHISYLTEVLFVKEKCKVEAQKAVAVTGTCGRRGLKRQLRECHPSNN